jgi:transketolase N-terminal domain/subunit
VNLIDFIYDNKKSDDIFVQGNGHAALAHYVVLDKHGLCDAEEMVKKHGTHASRDVEHGILVSNGSLGLAETVAVGMAIADRNRKVWLVTSDGSCMEGATHEALRLCDTFCRRNLEAFIVWNGYGAYSTIEEHELPKLSNVRIYYVDQQRYPEWLRGLPGHYLKLSKENYEELMS